MGGEARRYRQIEQEGWISRARWNERDGGRPGRGLAERVVSLSDRPASRALACSRQRRRSVLRDARHLEPRESPASIRWDQLRDARVRVAVFHQRAQSPDYHLQPILVWYQRPLILPCGFFSPPIDPASSSICFMTKPTNSRANPPTRKRPEEAPSELIRLQIDH